MNILSIQSWVAFGHVGNAAALLPLQRLGFEVWAIHTTQFSNHTGYGTWRGEIVDAAVIAELVNGLDDRGALASCAAVLTGYTGNAALGAVIQQTVARGRKANPKMIYCCDPVMGDVGRGFFVAPGLPDYFKSEAVPAADIITPNQFELEYLTGTKIQTLAGALAACRTALMLGPKIVLLTSLVRTDAAADTIEMLAVSRDAAWLIATPRLPLTINGAGDTVAALFLGHILHGTALEEALAKAAGAIYGLLEITGNAESRELLLVAGQDEIVAPRHRFVPQRIA